MSFLHLSTGILDHSSFANCSRCLRFEGCLLPTAVLRSLHRCSMGFRSGLIAGHFRTLQRFVLNHFCVLFEVCFGSLSCWKTHDLWQRPSSDTGPYIALQNSLVVFRFHDAMCTVKAFGARRSKATPKHLWTSTMFDRRDRVLFFEGLIIVFCKQYRNVLYQKALLWSHLSTWRSPRRILASSGKSGDGLVALRLSMLFHNFGSQILRQFFALLSFLHAQYGTHRHTTQRLSQLFSILTGCKCDFYITSTCYLPQVSLNTN